MAQYVIEYDRNRFPKRKRRSDGAWGCRGCGEPIPKNRRTWCSRECDRKFNPASVLSEVRKRDKDVCAFCGLDHPHEKKKWYANKPEWIYNLGVPPEKRISMFNSHQEWLRAKPTPINYDHIIPFCDGGLTVLENIRTLCEKCHKKRTKRWHKDRSIRKRGQKVLPLNGISSPRNEVAHTVSLFT